MLTCYLLPNSWLFKVLLSIGFHFQVSGRLCGFRLPYQTLEYDAGMLLRSALPSHCITAVTLQVSTELLAAQELARVITCVLWCSLGALSTPYPIFVVYFSPQESLPTQTRQLVTDGYRSGLRQLKRGHNGSSHLQKIKLSTACRVPGLWFDIANLTKLPRLACE